MDIYETRIQSAPVPDSTSGSDVPSFSFDTPSDFDFDLFFDPADNSSISVPPTSEAIEQLEQADFDLGSLSETHLELPQLDDLKTTPNKVPEVKTTIAGTKLVRIHTPTGGTKTIRKIIVKPRTVLPISVVTSSSAESSKASTSTGTVSSSTLVTKSPPVTCRVCGDRASGYHYGVTACEGCKGFFRRSIQREMEYRCLRDSKCMVIRLNRNRCQYCRFKKCLAVGMSRDSVRYGRSPRRKTRSTSPDPGSTSSSMDSEDHRLEVYDVILRIKQGHQANCAYTEDKVAGLEKKPIRPLLSGSESEEEARLTLWQQFALHLTPSIQRVVEFAKRIPGFESLIQSDQLILLKHGFFEIWMIHISRLYDEQAGSLTFADWSFITKAQLERVFNASLFGRLSDFWRSFNQLKLSDVEIGLDSALILLNPDRDAVAQPDVIREHRERVKEALETQISRSHLSSTSLMSSLDGMLDQLQSLSTDHNTALDWYRYRWQRLSLPPIFSEIFDIPKSADDIDE